MQPSSHQKVDFDDPLMKGKIHYGTTLLRFFEKNIRRHNICVLRAFDEIIPLLPWSKGGLDWRRNRNYSSPLALFAKRRAIIVAKEMTHSQIFQFGKHRRHRPWRQQTARALFIHTEKGDALFYNSYFYVYDVRYYRKSFCFCFENCTHRSLLNIFGKFL